MLRLMDWFCGAGGSSQGAHAVPGVEVTLAANHWKLAIDSHEANFPNTRHERGDIRDLDVQNWPVAEGFWASPECTKWTGARGKRRDYATTDTALPGLEPAAPEEDEKSRALMWDVPKYLEGVQRRGRLVLFGVVENVIEARTGRDWDRWLRDFHNMRYRTRLFAFNSMHAQYTRTHAAPQSRDRLYLVYWHESLGRDPDFDKWLRPEAYCSGCDRIVSAMQVFKNPKRDMGRYRQSYLYRCPSTSCHNTVVEPHTLPALTAIDSSIPGTPIGDRPKTEDEPHGLAPATIDRIKAGMASYWLPLLVPTGGTWRDEAAPLGRPMPTRTTRENDGVALAPLMVPVEGRDGKTASPADQPARTQTGRNETGIALPPFVIPLRGGGDKERARSASAPLTTVSAEGNHHGYVPPHLLVPYYGTGKAAPADRPVGALSTRDRYGLAAPAIDIDDVLFRMLEPHEIARAMAFANDYVVLGNKRQKVRQYGNAVTPPVAELLISALVEAVTGEDIERHAARPATGLAA
jgi:DNA (cytosine-5)-methyltransferase 1